MNTTLTASRSTRRPIFGSGNPIGEDTENVAFNIPKRAFKVLGDFMRGQNRSAKIRQWIAEGMTRENNYFGIAFRAACKLSNQIASIFHGTNEEKAKACESDVATVQPVVNPGEVPIHGAAEEFNGEKFIPVAGVVYPPEIKAQFPEIFGKGAK